MGDQQKRVRWLRTILIEGPEELVEAVARKSLVPKEGNKKGPTSGLSVECVQASWGTFPPLVVEGLPPIDPKARE